MVEAEDYSKCWDELRLFLNRYPESDFAAEAEKIQEDISAILRKDLNRRVTQLKQQFKDGDWLRAFAEYRFLQLAELPDGQHDAVDELEPIANRIAAKIRIEYQLLGHRSKMYNEEDVIEVRRVSTLKAAVDPDDAEARQLLEKAGKLAQLRAEKLVEHSKRYMHLLRQSSTAKSCSAPSGSIPQVHTVKPLNLSCYLASLPCGLADSHR